MSGGADNLLGKIGWVPEKQNKGTVLGAEVEAAGAGGRQDVKSEAIGLSRDHHSLVV